ncbi:MAG: hypothetical protein FJ291_20175 [Planctomycetes bacterium]|nr:hypothetical protein [Planctomycetota bacterium]
MRAGWLVIAAWACLAIARGEEGADRSLVLSEGGWWRQCARFAADHVSPEALKREGQQLLGPAVLARAKKQTEDRLRQAGMDPSKTDWRDHVLVRMFFEHTLPDAAPPLPEGWMKPEFDDASWVFERGPFHEPSASGRLVPRGLGWTRDDLPEVQFSCLGMASCCYRARFVVDGPAKADLTLRLTYRGGARVFVNGAEAARGHLSDAGPEDYPRAAYEGQPELRDRSLGPVRLPPGLLRKGANVLAIEVRASRLHPVVLGMKLAVRNHKVRQGMVGLWRHCGLLKLELRSPLGGVVSGLSRPAGVQVWVQDPHHRVASTDFLPPGEKPGAIRFAGAANGTYGAQLVVGTDSPLDGLRVRAADLAASGGGRIPAEAIRILGVAPYPAAEFCEAKLGDDRGLGATFPDTQTLTRFESLAGQGQPCVFDHILAEPPRSIPANSCCPIWLSLRIPADATPGTYTGALEVGADGVAPIRLPIEAEVVGWRLPDPRHFQTFIGCEQNPYAVAKQYGVQLWSDAHFKLIEASFRQLGRVGNRWLNVPVIARTEFGNRDDSLIRWRRRADGTLAFDYALLDRYLDLAAKHCGPPRVVNFVVMHGMKSASNPPVQPSVPVVDERSGATRPLALNGIPRDEKEKVWSAFATSLFAHMKARGQERAMFWGYTLEQEDDPDLKLILERCTPGVFWAANPHELLWNAVYAKDRHYRAIVTVRHQPGSQRTFPGFRADRGWKSPLIHLLSPRTGGNFMAIHTVSHPFAFRALVDLALATGHNGVSRLGADEWAAVHYDGMGLTSWLTGMPVLFMLWPGRDGAEPSVRFEMLLEGTQEAEARILVEQAIDGGRLPEELAKRLTALLAQRVQDTSFLQGTLCVHELERYHSGWQDRSRALYRAAAQVAASVGTR